MAAFKINHLHFKSPDPRKTAQWYVDNLGAKIVSEVEGAGGVVAFRLDLHGVPLNVSQFVQGANLEQFYGLEHLALETDDLPVLVEKLKSSGSRILEEREMGAAAGGVLQRDGRKVCFFEGPEGVRLELIEMEK